MAYGIKYQSDFYNFFGSLCRVQIAKEGYSGAVLPIRTTEVTMEVNFEDPDTSIIGTGAKVVIQTTSDDDSGAIDYTDLLTSKEKEFRLTLSYKGSVVFVGFSLCDINERQLLPFSRITVQFTDYLKRLDGHFLNALAVQSNNTSILTIIKEAFAKISTSFPIHVNSSLISTEMVGGLDKSFVDQTFLENNAFYEDVTTYDNTYSVINRILLSFGTYLYSYKGQWVLERLEDAPSSRTWVIFNSDTPAQQGSLRQILNKQNGDFKYVDGTQIASYVSGLQKLILNLKDSQLASMVFNDYSLTMPSSTVLFPVQGDLLIRTWYKYQGMTILKTGFAFRNMNTYVKYQIAQSSTYEDGFSNSLMYQFQIQFSPSEDKPSTLSISFKCSGDIQISGLENVYGRYGIRVGGHGPYAGWWLTMSKPQGFDIEIPTLADPNDGPSTRAIQVGVSSLRESSWTFSEEYNLTDKWSGDGVSYTSIWDALGKPVIQDFIIQFFPMGYNYRGLDMGRPVINYLGDIEVTLTEKDIVNKLTYYINEDFIKTEEIDVEFFDLFNINFNNGLRCNGGADKTHFWTSDLNNIFLPLLDIFALQKFRNYSRTTHTLKGTLLYDGLIKPFAIIHDNTLTGENIDLVVQSYTWDLASGKFDVVAEEFTDEGMNLIAPIDIEDPDPPTDSSGGEVITIPQGLMAEEMPPGYNATIHVDWAGVYSATGYRLQRKPTWYKTGSHSGEWRDYFSTVYEGTDTDFIDNLENNDGIPIDDMIVVYKVCALTNVYAGPYSAEFSLTWYLYP